MTGRMKILPIIQELMDRIVRDDEIEISDAVRAVHTAANGADQRKDIVLAMVDLVDDDGGFAAKDEASLRQLALENTDLVEPNA